MRRCYMVCYDIADEKRLTRVREVAKDFGARLQWSIYQCELNATELAMLRERLRDEINRDQDRVLIIDLGEVERPGALSRRVESMGKPPELPDTTQLVY